MRRKMTKGSIFLIGQECINNRGRKIFSKKICKNKEEKSFLFWNIAGLINKDKEW